MNIQEKIELLIETINEIDTITENISKSPEIENISIDEIYSDETWNSKSYKKELFTMLGELTYQNSKNNNQE